MAATPLRFSTTRAQYIKRVGPGWFSSIVARYGTSTLGYGKSDAALRRIRLNTVRYRRFATCPSPIRLDTRPPVSHTHMRITNSNKKNAIELFF